MKSIEIHWIIGDKQRIRMGFSLGSLYNFIDMINIFVGYIKYVDTNNSYPQLAGILRTNLDKIESLSTHKTYELAVSIVNSKLIMRRIDFDEDGKVSSQTLMFKVDIVIKNK